MRSTSGWRPRTMRSSHQRTSWPYWLTGFSGRPSTRGSGPSSVAPRGCRNSCTSSACVRFPRRSRGRGPNPARHHSRSIIAASRVVPAITPPSSRARRARCASPRLVIGERAHQHVAAGPQAHPQLAQGAVSHDPGGGDDLAARGCARRGRDRPARCSSAGRRARRRAPVCDSFRGGTRTRTQAGVQAAAKPAGVGSRPAPGPSLVELRRGVSAAIGSFRSIRRVPVPLHTGCSQLWAGPAYFASMPPSTTSRWPVTKPRQRRGQEDDRVGHLVGLDEAPERDRRGQLVVGLLLAPPLRLGRLADHRAGQAALDRARD